jgi:hypothetical protein
MERGKAYEGVGLQSGLLEVLGRSGTRIHGATIHERPREGRIGHSRYWTIPPKHKLCLSCDTPLPRSPEEGETHRGRHKACLGGFRPRKKKS